MSHLSLACHMRGITMEHHHDYDHFVESVGEQLMLMLWTSLATLIGVGFIMAIALSV
jgi:hypothetical protein